MSRTTIPTLLVLSLLLSATPLWANFVLLDANFDGKTPGAGLGRGGAIAGEPVEGVFDTHSEVVVVDSGNDLSVQSVDTSNLAGNNDYLSFQFLYGTEVSDGKLHISGNVTPESLDTYQFNLEHADLLTGQFFCLSWDGAGLVYWGDGDDVISSFTNYTAGVEVPIELVFDMDAGTYDFDYDGARILTGEAHGETGGIGSLIVGNQFDGNNTGSIRMDDLVVWWEPGTADVWLDADFNGQTAGQPVGVGGPAVGQPVSVSSNVTAEVRLGVTPTKSLYIADNSATGAGSVRFEFLDGAALSAGSLCVSFDLVFDQLQNASVKFREPGTATAQFADVAFGDGGNYSVNDAGGIPIYQDAYAAQTRIQVAYWFNAELEIYSLWIDGDRVLRRHKHGISSDPLGAVLFGHNFDVDLDGAYRVDNIQVLYLGDTPTSAEPLIPVLNDAAVLHPAAPNPFNPRTTLSYDLTRAGKVQLAVFDARGRRVATLVEEFQSAGTHSISWDGRDGNGGPVASGVYRAMLITEESQHMMPLTLLK